MLAPTHSVFGIFLTLIILAVFGVQWGLHWTIILFAILGAIIPDIDHPRSIIGKIFSPISAPLERRYGHRTVTHSLIGWLISTAVFSLIIIIPSFVIFNWSFDILALAPRWIAAFSISYFSHLILDMFNKRGSQMFWPDPGRDVIPRNPKFRPESGSKIEVLIFFILLALMFLAFPISKYGLASSLRWLLATPGSAIEEFKTLKTHAYLEFKGIMGETREQVYGRAEVLDVNNKRLVILFNGNVYTLSDELAADIFASHVRVQKTIIPIKTEKREFENETRESLLSQIPRGALVSGTVHLPEGMEIKIPSSLVPSSYKTMEQKGNDLILSFASRAQIERLALTEYFDLQRKKDQAELAGLYARAEKVQVQINEIEAGKGLTPLGKELLLSKEEGEKQKIQLAELRSQLDEINVKIEELQVKMKARKFIFSGEVYLRQ
ncbi:MAG: metal-dependent hydrolase, partial [Candidatus Margulisiibacteriota bacterium]